MQLFAWIGRHLARFLSKPREQFAFPPTCAPETLAATVRKGDVLLIEGTSRISVAIKYLTQSSWSHAALVVEDAGGREDAPLDACRLIEADVNAGVREVPLANYARYHTRICRPIGLSQTDIERTIAYVRERIGYQYDLKNIFDLARYLIQTPPVPTRWRRRLLALGGGNPTRAICSTLIAQAFQTVRYPILPEMRCGSDPSRNPRMELLYARHYSQFAPGDFDISPYFEIVKPTLAQGFDPYSLTWATT
jgi:hypothetical protein